MSKVRIAFQYHSVGYRDGVFNFGHYLDETDSAIISEVNNQTKEESIIFKFDSSCRMTNAKGTLIGVIRSEDQNNWVFYTVDFVDGKLTTDRALEVECEYPFAGEPEIIKWMFKENKLEYFKNK